MDQTRDSSRFEAALRATDRRYNTILFAGLGVTFVVSLLYESSHLKRPLIDYALVGVFFTSLICMVVLLAKEKNRIARAFGLECKKCNHLPLAGVAVEAFRSGKCSNCGSQYQSDAAHLG
jgi:hypothetical protein